jgi:hypothetical protein
VAATTNNNNNNADTGTGTGTGTPKKKRKADEEGEAGPRTGEGADDDGGTLLEERGLKRPKSEVLDE